MTENKAGQDKVRGAVGGLHRDGTEAVEKDRARKGGLPALFY